MGAADLDNVLPLFSFRRDPILQCLDRWNQPLLHINRSCDVHGGGKRVVGRLRHIDVIVGMNRRLTGKRRTGQLAATVGDHFVDVHVKLSAAAGHPHMEREHVVMLPGEYLVTDLNDQLVALVIEPLARMVRVGGGFLQNGIRGNHLARNEVLADTEVLKGALDLGVHSLSAGTLTLPRLSVSVRSTVIVISGVNINKRWLEFYRDRLMALGKVHPVCIVHSISKVSRMVAKKSNIGL